MGLCRCVLFRCSLENMHLGDWTCKKRHLLFSRCNRKKSGAPVSSDSFRGSLSSHRCRMLFRQQKSISGTWLPKLVFVRATKIEQRYNASKQDIELRYSLRNPHAGTVLFHVVMKKACCWPVPCNAYIDAALVYRGNIEIDNWVSKSPSFPLGWPSNQERSIGWCKITQKDPPKRFLTEFLRCVGISSGRAELQLSWKRPQNRGAWFSYSSSWKATCQRHCWRR